MVEAGKVTWDVVDVDAAHALAGCDEGLLEKLDYSKIGDKAKFLPGTALDCAVGTIVYVDDLRLRRRQDLTDDPPTTIADLFDTAKFPGKRALQKKPFGNLEWALMADGVPADKVYEVAGHAGRRRSRLQEARHHQEATSCGGKPAHSRRSCWPTARSSMTTAWNGRICNADQGRQELQDRLGRPGARLGPVVDPERHARTLDAGL